ncbi:MAG: Rieske 2Fe-2S domain-containing protein [Chloroflexi bacterium]|nr:Rieske 2Fe-2S domain-containing protein [Chloroflexota bacterium]
MANELWLERVQRAQEAASARRGVDVSVMRPPRNPSADGSTQRAEAVAQPVVADVVAEAEAVVAAATAVAEAEVAPAQVAVGGDAAANRVAAAKARAAAKAAANGAPAAPAEAAPKPAPSRPAPAKAAAVAEAPAEVGQAGMNRREFVTYAWAAALGLLTLEGGLATYLFMYPRFKEGQFGGKFILGPATILPPTDASPQPDTNGKFWLVNTDAGPKALYMVCTHLGCLYKWEPSNNRFECPCHGSKFSREGLYIQGPAPRSLDEFVVETEENGVVALTTDSDQGAIPPAVPSPSAEIRVNTGKRIQGRPAAESSSRDTT